MALPVPGIFPGFLLCPQPGASNLPVGGHRFAVISPVFKLMEDLNPIRSALAPLESE